MSSTFKLNGNFVTDPIVVEWQPIEVMIRSHLGARQLSKSRKAVFKFPVLTSAQFATWANVCDLNSSFAPNLMPRSYDAAMTSSPEIWNNSGATFTTSYRAHMLGFEWSNGVYTYNTEILIYMIKVYSAGGGG